MINHATIAILAVLLFANFARASRSCLDQDQAARTWPFRQLITDDDGCWTYRKIPLPIERPAQAMQVKPHDPHDPQAFEQQWNAAVEKEAKALEPGVPLMDRWPEPQRPVKKKPDVTVAVFVIFSIGILAAALYIVLFGSKRRT